MGQLATVRWLLERGVPPGTLAKASYRSNRIPPLFLAEHAEIARELLLHGADPLVIPDPGYMNTITPVQLAYIRGNFAVARELEEWGSDVALTPFHLAAARNDVAAVRRFVAWKTDVNCLGEMGYVGLNRRTPLHWAAISGSTGAVDALLEGQADPNFQDVRGRSPLHWATQLNKLDVVRSLLRANADPNLLDRDFKTPLMCAASARNVSRELFSELTAAGGNISYQLPTTGDTVLHVAVREENEASALAALACGGDLMRMNNEGLRPLDCTLSTRLLFGLKRAAGQRDVMISYTHSHQEFALKLRQSLEEANVTTWLDLMDPSGIGGGAVWREEIARGITNASVVLCILTEDYAASEWCLKELALAKQVGTPILAVSTEGASIDDDLQVYVYTRQIVPFEPAITGVRCDEGRVEYDYEESRYRFQFHLLLDGVRDEIEKNRHVTRRNNVASSRRTDLGMELESGSNRGTMLQTFSATPLSQGTDSCSLTTLSVSHGRRFVFLSHGDKHAAFVRQLASQLTDGGIVCYSDQNRSGQDFNTRIQVAQEAIMRCSCFVVLVSRQTIGNELVRDQLAFAEDKARPIFPVVLNDLEPGLDKLYTLVRSDLFHFMANGAGFNASCSKLMSDLRHYCNIVEAVGSTGGSDSENIRNLWTTLKSSRKT
uniref:TIR domain-containing protein n=1 Tax=Hyaloperonospora arabidopsidis (strain Emoy2) TaxID=559515 RepID=M4C0H5_HYAAE